MSFLLDTNAISETSRRSPEPAFAEWLENSAKPESRDGRVYISVLTVAELRRGVVRQAAKSSAEHLAVFTERVIAIYGRNIVPVDLAIAQRWAELAEQNRSHGRVVGVIDEMLAATAIVHDLTLVTRNIRHFEHAGCKLLSPWST